MSKKSKSRYMVGEGEWDGESHHYISRSKYDSPTDNPSDVANRVFVIRGFNLEKKKEDIKEGFIKELLGLIDGLSGFRKQMHEGSGELGVDEFVKGLLGLVNGLSVSINKEGAEEFGKIIPGLINSLLKVEPDHAGSKRGVDEFVKVVLGLINGFLEYRLDDDRSVLDHPSHPNNVVYLDGACKGPYEDARRKIFSLDHHAGCNRSITLATCEQSMTFARKRTFPAVNLTVIGTEPDLDTFFAIVCIVHADRVVLDNIFYERLRPIVSLEGNIDAYGFGHEDLLNLSENQIRSTRRSISKLISEERDLKSKGKWETTDFVEYTHRMMRRTDKFLFYDEEVKGPVVYEGGLDSVELDKDKEMIVAISSSSGIYEVEEEILGRYERRKKNCCCILYHDGKLKFTIKLTGIATEFNLKPVYAKLTEAERRAKESSKVRDPRLLECGWNGAKGIGGAPRYPNGAGSYLDVNTIKTIVAEELRCQVEEARGLREKSKNGNGHTNGNGNGHGTTPPADPKAP